SPRPSPSLKRSKKSPIARKRLTSLKSFPSIHSARSEFRMPHVRFLIAAVALAALAGVGIAQTATDVAALATKSQAELLATPAKVVFSAEKTPTTAVPRSIGFYAKGCIAGAEALPLDGPAWRVMRPSRNRYYGHPKMISLLERLANEAKNQDGWNGLLVGDIGQPRGGPMPSGHASHQVGL